MPSKIEWLDGGETWNPVTGCTKISAGCRNCYAARMAKRLAVMGDYGYPVDYPFAPGTWHENQLDAPLGWKKARNVFVSSMGDLFHDTCIKPAFRENNLLRLFAVMRLNARHRYFLLTKRPNNALKFFEWYNTMVPAGDWKSWPNAFPHVWLGVSVENQETADERLPILAQTPAAHRWVSYEPMLGPVDWTPHLPHLDWLVMGGETGPGARPAEAGWFFDTVMDCQDAQVPVFVKAPGSCLSKKLGRNRDEWPEALRVREMPT